MSVSAVPTIPLSYDGEITLAIGRSRKEMEWRNIPTQWSELVARVATPKRTDETLKAFGALSKSKQDDLKDVGGFVGGTLKGGRRMAASVAWRQLVTLDADFGDEALLFDLDLSGYAWCVYSTRKHGLVPGYRVRVLVPLSRPATPDEFQAVSRRVACDLGIGKFDETTHEPARLMYWPSCSADSEYLHRWQDAPWLDVDATLARYADWRDHTQWPTSGENDRVQARRAKQSGAPGEKPGIVGAFCRAWTIHDAIGEFLGDVYRAGPGAERYTYLDGSTSAGMVIYEGCYAYSNHGTDPASQRLCNAWDLVRLHHYGELDVDSKPDTPINRMPSQLAMEEWASKLPGVKRALADAAHAQIAEDFGNDGVGGKDGGAGGAGGEEGAEEDDWTQRLEYTRKGVLEPTRENYRVILSRDPRLGGTVAYNDFYDAAFALGNLPWRDAAAGTEWSDLDRSGIMHYLERTHKVPPPQRSVDDALALVAAQNAYHPVRAYLHGLRWDGIERLDSALIRYLGAADTPYVRAVTRKTLCSAVARVMQPGCKADHMLLFIGAQGNGKSTWVRTMGGVWTSDSLYTVQGKDAYEQLRGTWIVEMAELTATRRADVEAVKHFLSKNSDRYRAAYGRYVRTYLRQCIFIGSTNERTPLVDRTGNRRFWVVDVAGVDRPIAQWQPELAAERDQIWAEAFVRYQDGEPLYLSDELLEKARIEQEAHRGDDGLFGRIQAWLEEPVPSDWNQRSVKQRIGFYESDYPYSGPVMTRDRICAREVWVECLRGAEQNFSRGRAMELNEVLRMLEWSEVAGLRCGPYGQVRGFSRKSAKIGDFDAPF